MVPKGATGRVQAWRSFMTACDEEALGRTNKVPLAKQDELDQATAKAAVDWVTLDREHRVKATK